MSKVGAVLVAGGGIAGVQAALDLADSGYFVHLVEKSAAIGGVMAQLDKTFPTNDCSMCILSPKLVECGRHLNIQLHTLSEVEDIQGESGRFKVKVLQRPRFVDLSKCTACGECAKVCPVVRSNEYDEMLSERRAAFQMYPQAIPSGYTIEKLDRPPCVKACPAGVNAQGYINLIREERYEAALKLIYESLPIPGVLGTRLSTSLRIGMQTAGSGRIGGHLQPEALRSRSGGFDMHCRVPEVETKDEKVAIIGSGPAGLTAAYYLGLEGYRSTIFEALPVAGGMLRVGIPDYRLPPEVLDDEIRYIQKLGVELKLNHPIDKENGIDELFKQGYSAVYVAIGAHGGNNLGISGEDAEGVYQGVDFLRKLNLGEKVPMGKRLAVLGGGNVAIDVARSCRRLGAEEITIVYRRSREEMPAWEEEIEAALCEGINLHLLAAPVEIRTENGKVVGLRCIRMELGEPDESGRRRPVPIEGSEFDLDVDTIIPAIGQRPLSAFLGNGDGVKLSRWGGIEADDVTFETNRPGVFAGGDCGDGVRRWRWTRSAQGNRRPYPSRDTSKEKTSGKAGNAPISSARISRISRLGKKSCPAA